MAGELEQIVRPYETGQVTPAVKEIPGGSSPSGIVVQQWGRGSGSMKTYEGSCSWSVTRYLDHKPKEVEGETTVTEQQQ